MPTLVACTRQHVEAMQPGRVPTHFGPATRLRRPESPWNQGALATSQVEMCPRTANSGLALRVPATRVGAIIREREPRAVTADTALRLTRYFGTTPRFWLNLQSAHDLSRAEAERGTQIERDVHPRTV